MLPDSISKKETGPGVFQSASIGSAYVETEARNTVLVLRPGLCLGTNL